MKKPIIAKLFGEFEVSWLLFSQYLGYSNDAIKAILLKMGQSEPVISKAFYGYYEKQLKEYIAKARKAKYSDKQIKESLLKAGWREEIVEKEMRK